MKYNFQRIQAAMKEIEQEAKQKEQNELWQQATKELNLVMLK